VFDEPVAPSQPKPDHTNHGRTKRYSPPSSEHRRKSSHTILPEPGKTGRAAHFRKAANAKKPFKGRRHSVTTSSKLDAKTKRRGSGGPSQVGMRNHKMEVKKVPGGSRAVGERAHPKAARRHSIAPLPGKDRKRNSVAGLSQSVSVSRKTGKAGTPGGKAKIKISGRKVGRRWSVTHPNTAAKSKLGYRSRKATQINRQRRLSSEHTLGSLPIDVPVRKRSRAATTGLVPISGDQLVLPDAAAQEINAPTGVPVSKDEEDFSSTSSVTGADTNIVRKWGDWPSPQAS